MTQWLVVAGNIGVGKSTLTHMLADRLAWEPLYEAVDDNPYLSDFYTDMPRWSFHSQTFFLTRRLQQIREIERSEHPIVQDRSIYEDAEVFARNLYNQGNMTQRDWHLYRDLYEYVVELLPSPTLVVYLRASVNTLVNRIKLRGRDYERRINPGYLARLNALYDLWVENYARSPVLTVPADDLDFVTHGAHFDLIVEKIEAVFRGVTEVSFAPEEIARALEHAA
ncbi:MAG: deoxynucleoside kinase [Chloroflexi bacterium]|nr:deoxynucleoside kinase [Chloroflexota bacterium]